MSFDYKDLKGVHCRAARALLGWSQEDLERESGVSGKTIFNVEQDKSAQARTLRDLFEAFDKMGIEFYNGDEPGVRLRKKKDQ